MLKKICLIMLLVLSSCMASAADFCLDREALIQKASQMSVPLWLFKRITRISSPCGFEGINQILDSFKGEQTSLNAPYDATNPLVKKTIQKMGLDEKQVKPLLQAFAPTSFGSMMLYLMQIKCADSKNLSLKAMALPKGASACTIKESILESAHRHDAPDWFYNVIARQKNACLLMVANAYMKHIERAEQRLDHPLNMESEALAETLLEYKVPNELLAAQKDMTQSGSLASGVLLAQTLVCAFAPDAADISQQKH